MSLHGPWFIAYTSRYCLCCLSWTNRTGGMYFMTRNAAQANIGSNRPGEGALNIDKTKSGDRIENSRNLPTFVKRWGQSRDLWAKQVLKLERDCGLEDLLARRNNLRAVMILMKMEFKSRDLPPMRTADAMGGTYFMTWNAVRVNRDSDNTGEGALDYNEAF